MTEKNKDLDFQKKIEEFKKLWEKLWKSKNKEEKIKEFSYKDLIRNSYKKIVNQENKAFLDKILFPFILKSENKNLILVWKPWIGKTYLLENLLIQGRKYWLDAFYIDESQLYFEFKSNNLKKRNHEEKTCDVRDYLLEIVMKAQVLIYDDLGTVEITKAFYPLLKSIFDYRLKHNLKTIFISNFSIEELQEKLDGRLFDRILESHQLVNITSWTNKRHWWEINAIEI